MKKDLSLNVEYSKVRREAYVNSILGIMYALMFSGMSIMTLFYVTQLTSTGVLFMVWGSLIMLILAVFSMIYSEVLKNRLVLFKGLKK